MVHYKQHSTDNNHLETILGNAVRNPVTTMKLLYVHRHGDQGEKKVNSAYRYSHFTNAIHSMKNGCKMKIYNLKLIFPSLYM
jgi:hypothetical protein